MGSLDVYMVALQWKQLFFGTERVVWISESHVSFMDAYCSLFREDSRTAKRLGRKVGWNGMEEMKVTVRGSWLPVGQHLPDSGRMVLTFCGVATTYLVGGCRSVQVGRPSRG